jgi:hypothetical protein
LEGFELGVAIEQVDEVVEGGEGEFLADAAVVVAGGMDADVEQFGLAGGAEVVDAGELELAGGEGLAEAVVLGRGRVHRCGSFRSIELEPVYRTFVRLSIPKAGDIWGSMLGDRGKWMPEGR